MTGPERNLRAFFFLHGTVAQLVEQTAWGRWVGVSIAPRSTHGAIAKMDYASG